MLELTYVEPQSLKNLPYALEYMDHNEQGLSAAYELAQLPVVVNRTTMTILSSQGVVAALSKHERVPVLWGFWLPQHEKAVSIILNGGIDGRLLSMPQDVAVIDLLMNIELNHIPALGIDHEYAQDILDTLAQGSPVEKRSLEPRTVLGNDWGIPTLDVNLQAASAGDKVIKWGTVARTTPLPGATVHFYTEDEKFTALVKDPAQLVKTGCFNAVELNISINAAMPRALALMLVYQKRWVASEWQAQGLPVFVDMNVPEKFLDLNMLGVPARWRAYANRGYPRELDHLEKAYNIAVERAGGDIFYLVYGGGKAARDVCQSRGWHWIPDDNNQKRGGDGT